MPVIRQIEAQRGLGGAPRPSIQVDDGIARGLSQLGNSLESAAAAEQDMQLRLQRHNMQVQEFRSDQQFRQFDAGMGTAFVEAQQNMDPSGVNLTENFVKQFDAKAEEYLTTVPEALRPKMAELVQTSRAGWVDKVAVAERDQRYNWYRTGITESQEKLQGQVFNDPELYEAAREDGYRAINTSGLPEAEKEELRRQWDDVLSVTVAEREIRNIEQDPAQFAGAATRLGIPGATQNGGDAASLVRQFEGFREGAYWDVNAYRTGYGSDTVTRADGTVEKVTKNTVITQADAERDLARRLKEFERTAIGQVGIDQWAALPPNAQAALVSVAYNYGSLPKSVEGAVRGGDVNAIANAVASLDANPERRKQEAAIIRGGSIASNAPEFTDDRYAGLALDKRLEIYDRMSAAEGRGRAALDAQRKAIQSSTYDSLTLGIETGDVVSDQTILGARAIDDGQKATLLKALRTKRDETAGVNELISAITSGGGVQVNSFDGDQTKVGDKAYKRMIEATPEANRPAVTRAFIQETGYIPEPERASIRNGVLSDDIATFASTMQRADWYQKAAPRHFESASGFDAAQESLSDWRYYTNDLGMGPDEAARRIISSRSDEVQRSEEVLGKQADKLLESRTVEEVTSHFDGVFRWEPGTGATLDTKNQLLVEYRREFRDEFLRTGDEGVAKRRALDTLQRTWGVSSVSGSSQLMKYPPEKMYPPVAGSHDYLTEDAMATAKEYADGEVERIALIPRPETRRDFQANRPPRYSLVYFEKGSQVPEMVPGTWAMPMEEIQALQEKRNMEAREAARERRDELRQEEERRYPEGRDGPERFSNDQLYRGIAREGSPLAEAARRQQERRAAERKAEKAKREAERPKRLEEHQELLGPILERFD